jgi:hypothetical protein
LEAHVIPEVERRKRSKEFAKDELKHPNDERHKVDTPAEAIALGFLDAYVVDEVRAASYSAYCFTIEYFLLLLDLGLAVPE